MSMAYGVSDTCSSFIRDKIEGIPKYKVLSITGLAEKVAAQFLISKNSAYNRINMVIKRDPIKDRFEKRKGKPVPM